MHKTILDVLFAYAPVAAQISVIANVIVKYYFSGKN